MCIRDSDRHGHRHGPHQYRAEPRARGHVSPRVREHIPAAHEGTDSHARGAAHENTRFAGCA
eukprot:2248886-Karenia_brevis.AAC.1